MATIYEVSKLAGVSLATVSRVMNKNAKVSDKTRKKVEAAMAELGYKPNSIAQSLASKRSSSVGVLVSELHGPFYGIMMSGIEKELRKAHKHVIIAAGHSEEDYEKESIEFLISRKCDALILHVEAVSDEYLINLCKGDLPVIILNRFIPEIKDRCIGVDNEYGGYIAAKHIVDLGHRNIAYIAGPKWKRDSSDRLKGHKRALEEAGIEFDEQLIYEGSFLSEAGRDGLQYFVSTNKPFSAIICANDEMASGAIQEARSHNFNVPENLSIMGFDNISFTDYMYPKLCTVDNPVNEIGKMAAQWVLNSTYNAKHTIKHLYKPTLIIRDSAKKL